MTPRRRPPRTPSRAAAGAALLTLLALATTLVTALGGVLVAPATASSTDPAPAPSGAVDLPGVNDWSCRPTATHPEPAVVVHGTFGDRQHLLERLESTLVAQGYCTYALDYGDRAMGPIEDSAAQLRDFVDRVRGATGAAKVEMVGHSQGGMMPRYYIKFLGGDTAVDDLVGLAPSNHGTVVANKLDPYQPPDSCISCEQQEYDSPFLQNLNADDETPGEVSYTAIETRNDEVVVPYTSAFLSGPSTQVSNLLLQNYCPADSSEHLTIPSDGTAIRMTLDAFAHPGPASTAPTYSCLP